MAGRPGAVTSRQAQLQQAQAAQRARERRLLGIVALVVVLALVGGGLGLQFWRSRRAPTAVPALQPTSPTAAAPLSTGKPIMLGASNAPVRLTLYADFHCSHCVEVEERLGPTVASQLDADQVGVDLFPLAIIDEGSRAAANAIGCAAESGFAWPYYRGLYANHTRAWSDEQLLDLAAKVTTTVPDAFRSCVSTDAAGDWVDSIAATATANGVTGTPTMLLAGQPVDLQAATPESLQRLIDTAATTTAAR